jgi:hypothetical protein
VQLDRTEIVVRARSAPELFDLSLQVLKRHGLPIAMSALVIGGPLMLVNGLAIAWMLSEDGLLAADHLDQPLLAMRWRHAWHWIALFVAQFPLMSLPTSIYLGHQIFYEPLPLRVLLLRLRSIAFRCLWVLGFLRLGLCGLLLEPWVNPTVAFDWLLEFWLIFASAACAVLFRVARPFAPEILGLELCRLRPRRPGEIGYRLRNRDLHRFLFSENVGRFMAAACYGSLLLAALIAAQLFVIGVSTGHWQWSSWIDYVGLPLSLWCVGLFMAVFRFLSYLDSRIRLEGWEVELRLKAEAVRLSPPQPIATEAKATVLMMGLFVAAWLLPPAGLTFAQANAEQALRDFPKNVWYDPDTRQYIPPKIPPADDSPWRQAGWVETSPSAPAQDSTIDNSWWDWVPPFPNLSGLAEWIPRLVFAVLGVALLIVIGSLTYYSLRNYLPGALRNKKSAEAIEIDPARVLDLPFEVQAVDSHPLAEAERLMRVGAYNGAIVFLYGYLLLALDQSRKIHLQKGKTNRMYLRELGQETRLREIVYQAMLRFEDGYFGKHSISREQFLEVWAQVDEFHRRLEPPRAADNRLRIAREGSS